MSSGDAFRLVIQSENAPGKSAKPRNRTKISTPQMIVKIMTVSFAVSIRASLNSLRRIFRHIAMQKTINAPMAPPSVGVPHASSPKGL